MNEWVTEIHLVLSSFFWTASSLNVILHTLPATLEFRNPLVNSAECRALVLVNALQPRENLLTSVSFQNEKFDNASVFDRRDTKRLHLVVLVRIEWQRGGTKWTRKSILQVLYH